LNYSFNRNKEGVVFAGAKDINASFKDLCAVGDSIRYTKVPEALKTLDLIISMKMPIEYRRHNAYMGSRHEIGGKKGRYPKKCAAIVRKVLVNAAANAKTAGLDTDNMYVIHYAANKTNIIRRGPSKGNAFWGRGMYGRGAYRRMDLELARVEIGLSEKPDMMGRLAQYSVKNLAKDKTKPTNKDKKVEMKAKAKV
jgi:large subunit ribosomal protein L22